MRLYLSAFNARYIHSCPALFSVRNALEQHIPDNQITFRQFTINDPFYETLLALSTSNAEAFFFSVYIWNIQQVSRLVNDLAKIFPKLPIVLGGPQVSYGPIDTWPENCTIIRGEIEGLEEPFYTDLQNGTLQREYSATSTCHFPSPYKEEDFLGALQKRHIYYESTRGCPFSCSYCLSSAKAGIRQKDMEQVKNELSAILQHTPRSLRFVDRTFNANPARALEIWQFLAQHDHETPCHFEIAPDIFNDAMFDFLKGLQPGKFEFEIGLQTTNKKSLAAVNRSMDLEKTKSNISRLVALDTVHLHLDLILGLPYETEASFQESFNTVFAMGPHYIQMGLLKVLPGTEIHKRQNEFGFVFSQEAPYSILATKWLPHESLGRLYWLGECVEGFYNNRFFRNFFKYIRKNEDNYFALFSSLLDYCHKAGFFHLASTQELMTRIICAMVEDRPDQDLLVEVLRYDWLRCGHRFLPEVLKSKRPLSETKDHLWKNLPQNLEPHFNYKTRNTFFKQGTFMPFSGKAMKELGFEEEDSFIAFLPQREKTVLRHHRTIVFPKKTL